MHTFISGPSAFIELKKVVEEFRGPSQDEDLAVVTLSPSNLSVREVRLTDADIIFFGYLDMQGKYRAVPVTHGDEFKAVVDVNVRRSQSVPESTKFIDQSQAGS
jgi:hypothetical protein